jgi:hypothetical protein
MFHMSLKSTKFQYPDTCEGWLRIIEFAPMAILIVDESNSIMWMNATAYTMFKVSTEAMLDDIQWDSLVFSLEPEGTAPGDLLGSACNSMGPFKAVTTDTNAILEVNVQKVQFGGTLYACCYISSGAKYVHDSQCLLVV